MLQQPRNDTDSVKDVAEYDERYTFHFASEYLDRGWSTIPLSGKKPAISSWLEFQTRRPTMGEVASWFGENCEAKHNVGIVTGRISGIVVIDCDTGEDTAYWREHFPTSPLTVTTGSGGSHIYYRLLDDTEVRNRIRIHSRKIDVRGEGGYVVAPPSRHPNGSLYRWESWGDYSLEEVPVLDPTWLVDPHTIGSVNMPPIRSRDIRDPVAYIQKITAVSGNGGHNATYRCVCILRDAGYSPEEAMAELVDWSQSNADPPWTPKELLRKVTDAYKRST